MLTKSALLEARDRLRTEPVEIPHLGDSLLIRELNAGVRIRYVEEQTDKAGDVESLANAQLRLVQLSIVDEAGELVFGHEEIEALAELPGYVVEAVFHAATRLNGFSDEEKAVIVGE